MGLDRRTFLQQAGLALFTLGVTEAGISSLAKNPKLAPFVKSYVQTLAQSTNRKLALLVGINQYPQNNHLDGCLTDVELQKELLINRFGFKTQDIITLCDRQATRENIETAFIEHLSQQASPDDVVVFHFSGYGSQVKMPLSTTMASSKLESDTYKLVNSLVPSDGILPTKGTPAANYLIQDTLLLLAQSLSTDRLSLILDTSNSIASETWKGNLKIRSYNFISERLSPEELAFREQLQIRLSAKGIKPGKRLLSSPGLLLSAAGKNQVAVEGKWNGFSAGLFTYALTQYLWHITPAKKLQVAMQRTNEAIERVMGKQQQPAISNIVKPTIGYYMTISQPTSAEAVVSNLYNNSLELKLLGLPVEILDCYQLNSCFSLINHDHETEPIWLQIKSREGLKAKAQILNQELEIKKSFHVGQLAKEAIRVLPRDLGLTVALDRSLERIERVDATSALANTPTVASVTMVGEQNADCLLAKIPHNNINPVLDGDSTTEIAANSYGLLSPGGVIITNSQGVANEAVKSAISRLEAQFSSLLTIKWLTLTNNEFSSGLKLATTLKSLSDKKPLTIFRNTQLAEEGATESNLQRSTFPSETNNNIAIPTFVKNTAIELNLQNKNEFALYPLILETDADGNITSLYMPQNDRVREQDLESKVVSVLPQSQLLIPATKDTWEWKISPNLGIKSLYIFFATQPFNQTLAIISNEQNLQFNQSRVLNIPDSLAVVKAILEDLHLSSAIDAEIINPSINVYAWNTNNWASLNFTYQVVES